jgi:hypothetical protein
MLVKNNPEVAKQLADELQKEVDARLCFLYRYGSESKRLI